MNVAETLAALAISQEADFPTWEVNLLEEGGLLAATAAPDLAPASASSRSSLASEQCPAEAARHVGPTPRGGRPPRELRVDHVLIIASPRVHHSGSPRRAATRPSAARPPRRGSPEL